LSVHLLALIAVALFFAGVPYALSLMIRHLRPGWTRWRKILVGALPLPFGVAVMSASILIDASRRSPQDCGVDACGYNMIFGTGGLILAAMGAVLGLAIAAVAVGKE
jgi:hypothetical protein